MDWLRRRLRASEVWFIGLALLVGVSAGLLTMLQSALARVIQTWCYRLPADLRLSASARLGVPELLMLPLGGLLLGAFGLLVRARRRPLVDAVEANALHGGRMSMRDNLVVSGQTLLSNGFGASVGLEAAYAQMGGGIGSQLGRVLRLRRNDMRTLVGAGAGAAIAAAFGAPLTGAFYAFEIVIGAYSPPALAPVAAAVLSAVFVTQWLGAPIYALVAPHGTSLLPRDYAVYVALGMACALVGIAIMRLVTTTERMVGLTRIPHWLRPAIGGLLLVPLAMATPQVLSAGHGALHIDMVAGVTIRFIALVFVLKAAASILSLAFGFRGGLFFASLFLGSLLGSLFSGSINALLGFPLVNGTDASLVAMAALAAAIVGAPMTMAMLALEATHDFILASAVMAAVLVASTLVRQVFGYSFSTWRLHLRGETIMSARDVGWVKTLSAGKMMRKGMKSLHEGTTVADFRKLYPLGSGTRVVLQDAAGRYAGIVPIASAYADNAKPEDAMATLAQMTDRRLHAQDDIEAVMRAFDAAQTDELAVVDADGNAIGLLSEAFVRKRYAEELEKKQREMFGERITESD
ncbi:MAG: chloride channel protein [Proteobacteria bacterium]|nr:chloride channel protein [Pseudomonadota bacterium]